MPAILLLRFDAPLVAFGGVHVDELGPTERFPGRSMLTGLLANALGWEHRDAERLSGLQDRLVIASRVDREGTRLVDHQTVDLGQDFLKEEWTTWGDPAGRAGGSAKEGTHIRYRHYLADSVVTVAVMLAPANQEPTIADLATALAAPERPLFLGRKPCLPSARILLGTTDAADVRDALRHSAPIPDRSSSGVSEMSARWPAALGGGDLTSRLVAVYEDRDWANQVHVGRSFYREGRLGEAPNG